MSWTNIPVLLLMYGFPVSAGYYVNRTITPFDYNSPPCKLASPVIGYSRVGPFVNLPSDLNIDLDERVFVGYAKILNTFEYIGCIWDGPVQLKSWIALEADPGQCYSACQTTYFGINGHKCYCSPPRNVTDTNTAYDKSCSFPTGTVCGGYSFYRNHFISLYRHVSTSENGLDDEKYCRMYDQHSNSFVWQTCDTQLRGLCQTDAANLPFEMTGSSVSSGPYMKQWNGYPELCFDHDKYPASERIDRIGSTDETDFWIGSIKSWVIVDVTKYGPDDSHYGNHGYISKSGNYFFLHFTKETTGSFLCIIATATTPTITTSGAATTTSVAAAATTMITTTSKIRPKTNTVNDVPTTPYSSMASVTMSKKGVTVTMVTPNNQDGDKQGDSEENRSSVTIAAYILIPVVVIIVVAIVILAIRKKRNQSNDKGIPDVVNRSGILSLPPNGNSATTVANATYSNDFDIATSKGYSACDPLYANTNNPVKPSMKTDNKVHRTTHSGLSSEANTIYSSAGSTIVGKGQEIDYFVIEKPGAATENKGLQNMDDETYNTTNAVPMVNDKLHGNIYNRLSDFSEDTYNNAGNKNDHVYDATNLPEKGKVTDNVYNVFSKDDDSDNLYNTTYGECCTQGQHFEDTYSHIK